MRNWKTTTTGCLSIVLGITRIGVALKNNNITEEAIASSASLILSGVGLLFAKDFNVTGVKKKTETP